MNGETSVMKGIVFDLDDTILRNDLSISDYTIQVFRMLSRSGFTMVAASGRAKLSMKRYVDQLSCLDAYISCNGAEIWNAKDHSLIHQELFSASTAIEIALFAEENDCYAQVYEGDKFYFNRYGVYADRYAASSSLKGVYVGPLSSYIHEPRNKILFFDEEGKINFLYHEAKNRFSGRASVTRSKPVYLEFNPVNATKGIALTRLAPLLGLKAEDFIAFGDSLNDLSMLQAAGVAAMVSNGWKEIRPYCDIVCQSNEEDGPARYLAENYLASEVKL